jgi:hypothetical protein
MKTELSLLLALVLQILWFLIVVTIFICDQLIVWTTTMLCILFIANFWLIIVCLFMTRFFIWLIRSKN